MTMSVVTNLGALTALQALERTNSALEETQSRVATGLRVSQVQDDAASFSIASRMQADISSLESVNIGLGIADAVLGTAVGASTQIRDLLTEMKAKAVQGTSGGLTATDRQSLSAEIVALQDQITTISATAEFNNVNLIKATPDSLTVAGDKSGGNSITITGVDLSATVAIDVSTTTAAVTTEGLLQTKLDLVLTTLATFGSSQTRVQSQSILTNNLIDSLTAGVGALVDADMARESSRLQSLQIQQQLGVQALSIANASPQSILSLFS